MRHLLANLAVYILAAGLVIGSVLFAWIRDAQIIIATEPMIEPPEYAAAEHPDAFPWPELGRRVYVANCQNCHGADGRGRDVYPPITGQVTVLTAEDGRDYLSRLVVFGLYTGLHRAPMPPMPHLTDTKIAAVNNYMLTRFDDPDRLPEGVRLFVPHDVQRIRDESLSERDVGRMRPKQGER